MLTILRNLVASMTDEKVEDAAIMESEGGGLANLDHLARFGDAFEVVTLYNRPSHSLG
ncbi:hypothetical protein ACFQY5_35800 [Paeniroseomonas aquatica]|uniref:hypothetical protein n=1 Tax=Paeniroseomonas aquatica TaxID=373043 RepID=UPI0036131139